MKKIKKCVIPAAGFGTRFLPASKALPKEMFPIIDKPVMQYLVEEAISAGCEDIIIITGRNKRAIEDHFDSNFELESKLKENNKTISLEKVQSLNNMATIVYVRQPYPRGDGEAILRAQSIIGDEPFLVLFGDDIIDNEKSAAMQLVEAYQRKNTPIIATVPVESKDVSSYGIIESISQETNAFLVDRFLEKPTAQETPSRNGVVGKYVLTSDIFKYLKKAEKQKTTGEIRLADAFELMRQKQDIYGIQIEGKRYDTGSKIGFLEATLAYALKHPELQEDFKKLIKNLHI